MKPGDLIQDMSDEEIGLVVAIGPGYHVLESDEYPDGTMPSWKVKWPSIASICDLGEDSLAAGLVEIICEA